MKKKAQITNVTKVNGKFRVEYESGAIRTYSKMTKTIETWIQKQKQELEPVYNNPFFKDRASEVIFYLTQADGEMRMFFLGINKIHYNYESAAKRWRDSMMKIIHPDNCNHPLATEAAAEVNRIYEGMIA